ncbi:MAG: hypothetical protein ICV84_01090 [Flavisolibacter sp.]|nr:hypothetical protein [Flavisolibacter sp.]
MQQQHRALFCQLAALSAFVVLCSEQGYGAPEGIHSLLINYAGTAVRFLCWWIGSSSSLFVLLLAFSP